METLIILKGFVLVTDNAAPTAAAGSRRFKVDGLLAGSLIIYSIVCAVALMRSPQPADTATIIALFQLPLQIASPAALRMIQQVGDTQVIHVHRKGMLVRGMIAGLSVTGLILVSSLDDYIGVTSSFVLGIIVAATAFVVELYLRTRQEPPGVPRNRVPGWWVAVSLIMAALLILPFLSTIGIGIPTVWKMTPVAIFLIAPPFVAWMVRRIESGRSLRKSVLIPSLLTVALLAVATISPIRFLDPYIILAGKLRIGVNGNLPGWSKAKSKTKESKGNGLDDFQGFDIEFIRFLHERYRTDPEIIPITQDERLHQWDAGSGHRNGSVDLVISTFSMTPDRITSRPSFGDDLKMSMAGPYYLDVSSTLFNGAKSSMQTKKCSVIGTTGEPITLGSEDIPPKTRLEDCFRPFYDPHDATVTAVRSDWGILRAFDTGNIVDQNNNPYRDAPDPQDPSKYEMYGVGFARGGPDYCKALIGAIKKFIEERWESAFDETLTPLNVVKSWHKPVGYSQEDCSSMPKRVVKSS